MRTNLKLEENDVVGVQYIHPEGLLHFYINRAYVGGVLLKKEFLYDMRTIYPAVGLFLKGTTVTANFTAEVPVRNGKKKSHFVNNIF